MKQVLKKTIFFYISNIASLNYKIRKKSAFKKHTQIFNIPEEKFFFFSIKLRIVL